MKYAGLLSVALLPVTLQAQTISFETQDYKSLGVYDTWENSTFRTGALSGNFAVVDNHLKDGEANPSEKILGIQRSRFGSNTFGVRIDLNETFELTPTVRYAHVMIHKPHAGRVMLIGLGKRANRPDQSADVEQFWSYPVNDVKVGEWFDAVFPIKGNGGIDIYSLVVVPDCEAPHTLDGDFVAYVDDIVINDNMRPRFGVGYYPVNFSPDAAWGRSDRKINGIALNGGSDGNQSVTITDDIRMGYTKLLSHSFKVKAGNTVTPVFTYAGDWMHGFVYLDRGNDGDFSFGVNSDNTLNTSTDLVAYSWYNGGSGDGAGKNSAGTSISTSNNRHNVLNPPSFTIPSNLAPGFYRMRYKVDWNSIDAGGNIESSNNILSNGGGIVDIMLNVHSDNVSVTQDNRNGEVLIASTGNAINNDRIPFGQDFKIRMNPSNGFEYNGIRVRHGYNLTGDSIVRGNPQYRDEFFYSDEFGSDDTFTIPGSVIDGDILIEGLFVEQGNASKRSTITYNIKLNGETVAQKEYQVRPGAAYPEPSIETEVSADYYSFAGVPEGTVGEEDEAVNVTLVQSLPFESCSAIDDDTMWYNLSLSGDKNPLVYDASTSYISLSSAAVPAKSNEKAQWAFVGNVLTGFKIVNRAAGDGNVLSSATAITSTNDGSVYPTVIAEPVPATHNSYWIPTKSSDIAGGFYLHQLGFENNRMNKRDNRLAYWVGGAGTGSTFTLRLIDDSTPEIEYCVPSPISGRKVSGTITDRTDRYLSNVTFSDGESSVVINGGGTNSGREVYVDRTASVFSTEDGKTITVNAVGAGFWVNTFLYIDFDQNGFDMNDRVFSNYAAGQCNLPTLDFSFDIPAGTPSGLYRARFIHDWENTDPCKYGQAGSDNGELAMDFYVQVTSYATVNVLSIGNGNVELWSTLNRETGMPTANSYQIASGDRIATGANSQLGVIVVPDTDIASGQSYGVSAIIIKNGENDQITLAENESQFIEINDENYGHALAIRLSPVVGDVEVSVTFSDELSGIKDILMNPADGPIDIYTLQGVKVNAENLTNGFYILRQG